MEPSRNNMVLSRNSTVLSLNSMVLNLNSMVLNLNSMVLSLNSMVYIPSSTASLICKLPLTANRMHLIQFFLSKTTKINQHPTTLGSPRPNS